MSILAINNAISSFFLSGSSLFTNQPSGASQPLGESQDAGSSAAGVPVEGSSQVEQQEGHDHDGDDGGHGGAIQEHGDSRLAAGVDPFRAAASMKIRLNLGDGVQAKAQIKVKAEVGTKAQQVADGVERDVNELFVEGKLKFKAQDAGGVVQKFKAEFKVQAEGLDLSGGSALEAAGSAFRSIFDSLVQGLGELFSAFLGAGDSQAAIPGAGDGAALPGSGDQAGTDPAGGGADTPTDGTTGPADGSTGAGVGDVLPTSVSARDLSASRAAVRSLNRADILQARSGQVGADAAAVPQVPVSTEPSADPGGVVSGSQAGAVTDGGAASGAAADVVGAPAVAGDLASGAIAGHQDAAAAFADAAGELRNRFDAALASLLDGLAGPFFSTPANALGAGSSLTQFFAVYGVAQSPTALQINEHA